MHNLAPDLPQPRIMIEKSLRSALGASLGRLTGRARSTSKVSVIGALATLATPVLAIPILAIPILSAVPVMAQDVPVVAQDVPVAVQDLPPQTDIYVGDLSVFDGLYFLANVHNVTNRPEAYDNQPQFAPDSRSILYTAAYDDGNDGQTEIHRYYLSSGRNTRITRTTESEYSPTPIPGDRAFSTIQVEADSMQRLWRFTMEGMDAEVVLREVAPVGYHAWGNEESILLFVLGDPPTLQVADATTGVSEVVADSIGRSLNKIPNRNAWSFVERVSVDESWISEINIGTHEILRLIQTRDGGDFHAWTPEGVLLMASGGQILQWDPEVDAEWRVMAELRYMNLTFSRIAVSPDGTKIALVAIPDPEDGP